MNSKISSSGNMNLYDKNFIESLKSGYAEMSPINLKLAEEAVGSDNEALTLSEQNVRSVKLSDS